MVVAHARTKLCEDEAVRGRSRSPQASEMIKDVNAPDEVVRSVFVILVVVLSEYSEHASGGNAD